MSKRAGSARRVARRWRWDWSRRRPGSDCRTGGALLEGRLVEPPFGRPQCPTAARQMSRRFLVSQPGRARCGSNTGTRSDALGGRDQLDETWRCNGCCIRCSSPGARARAGAATMQAARPPQSYQRCSTPDAGAFMVQQIVARAACSPERGDVAERNRVGPLPRRWGTSTRLPDAAEAAGAINRRRGRP